MQKITPTLFGLLLALGPLMSIGASAQLVAIIDDDFSSGFGEWTVTKLDGGSCSGGDDPYPRVGLHTHGVFGSDVAMFLDTPCGAAAFVERALELPASEEIVVSFVTFGHRDAVTVTVSILDTNGTRHTIDTFDPQCKVDLGCDTPEIKSYDVTSHAGQSVSLRFHVTSGGGIGTFADFDDFHVEVAPTQLEGTLRVTPRCINEDAKGVVTLHLAAAPESLALVNLSSAHLGNTTATVRFVGADGGNATFKVSRADGLPSGGDFVLLLRSDDGLFELNVASEGTGVGRCTA